MFSVCQIAPTHEVGTGTVDTGEVRVIALFRHGGINMMADRDQAGGQQTDTTLSTGKEILQHLVVGSTGFLGHLAVAHRCHHQTVLHCQLVDLNGGKQLMIGIKLLGHTSRTALAVFTIRADPVAKAIDQLLY